MRWLSLLLPLCGVGLVLVYRASRAQTSVYVSSGWVKREQQRRRTAALEFEGVSHVGKFNR